MKKTFKLVGIFAAVLVFVSAAAVGIYALISNNKTYYIYDLRFVKPLKYMSGYVYTDPEQEYVTLRNQQVYLSSSKEDRIPVAIYANTSAANPPIEYTTSDSSVADLIVEDNKCYIEYYKVGEATITINIGKVCDTFKITVFNQIADEFFVYDQSYYGEYSKIDFFKNKVVSYSDGQEYRYSYEVLSAFDIANDDLSIEDAAKQSVNSSLLRIDQDKINTDVFEYVKLDAKTKKLVLKCRTGLTTTVDDEIIIQSFSISAEGEVKTGTTYVVKVHIIAYTPKFLQIELSTNPDFTDNVIFMNTIHPGVEIDKDNVEENIDNLNKILDYEKAEKYLAANGETSTYHAYFTEKVPNIYLRFRSVYTNGDIVELLPTLNGAGEGMLFTLTGDTGALTVSQNEKYYILEANTNINLTVSLNDVALSHTFTFEYKTLTADNIDLFYTQIEGTDYLEYTYWDSRTYYDGEICDANGNIVKVGVL